MAAGALLRGRATGGGSIAQGRPPSGPTGLRDADGTMRTMRTLWAQMAPQAFMGPALFSAKVALRSQQRGFRPRRFRGEEFEARVAAT
jgi:hypothetical protein